MKKIGVILILIVVSLSIFNVCVIAEESEGFLAGDVDFNGEITAADARMVLRISAKLDAVNSDDIFKAADIDGSRDVTANDARKILRIAAKLENCIFEDDYTDNPTTENDVYLNFQYILTNPDELENVLTEYSANVLVENIDVYSNGYIYLTFYVKEPVDNNSSKLAAILENDIRLDDSFNSLA